ncbi:MAG TPA: hypothetical protein ENG83_01555 [Nitrospirae bacterium]|nr:hypothetical protein BMS3Abin06_02512 [bacterium BMS3Abin06]HDH10886.1 hypothetical protein [Nitrospirota bacterium]HDL20874.1 hypothetical protein [Nitrospirota bacterium]HDZ03246.1 hypothetical protein [Nitrospirota bacterium]
MKTQKTLLVVISIMVSIVFLASAAHALDFKLSCVTASMKKGSDSDDDIHITNQKNIEVSHWSEVFIADTYDGGRDAWGLICKDDWVNTGCSQGSNGWPIDTDVLQYDNGCFSDDEELENLSIFTTCCKIIDDKNGGDH